MRTGFGQDICEIGKRKNRRKECWKSEEGEEVSGDSHLGGGPLVQIPALQSGREKLMVGGKKLAAAAGVENDS